MNRVHCMQLDIFRGHVVRFLQVYACICLALSGAVSSAVPAHAETFSPDSTVVLNTSEVGSGSISRSPNKPQYNLNEVVTLTATPNPGWELDKWEVTTFTAEDWWDVNWRYRVSLEADPDGFARSEMPVEAQLDFAPLLTAVGASAGLSLNSLRLVEVDGSGVVVDASVPFQFEMASGFDPVTNPEGMLVWLMEGSTASNAVRSFHLYFDTLDKSFTAPNFADRVAVSNGNDQGQASFHIETDVADYDYQKTAGGFSSLIDVDGNDWIDYNSSAGASGEFRGIPNMVFTSGNSATSFFHPGFTNSTSQLNVDGPVRATVTSNSDNGKWQVRWAFYPRFARMTVLKADHAYWFLYEGTPGGVLEPSVDYVVRPLNGVITQTLASVQWSGDIQPEEWAYFVDPNVGAAGRALYVVQTPNDALVDSYRPMDGAMTVFGFGRQGTTSLLTGTQRSFVVGLLDDVAPNDASVAIQGAYKPVSVQIGSAESQATDTSQLPPNSPLQLTMDVNKEVVAYFTALDYSVTAAPDDPDRGSVVVSPNGPYAYGDEVTVTATADPGWRFSHWSGDLTSDNNPETLVVDDDKSVTAVFVADQAALTLAKIGQGQVAGNPAPPYTAGQTVTITAEPAANWYFTGWTGDFQGVDNPAQVTLDTDKTITATFVPVYVLNTTVDGPGTVMKTPTSSPDTLDNGRYLAGTNVALQAVPGESALFAGWGGDLNGAELVKNVVMDRDTAVEARFLAVYQLATQTTGAGILAVTPAKSHAQLGVGQYADGTQVSIEAQPALGWVLKGWSGDATGTANPLTVTITGTTSITADFGQVFRLTAGQNSGNGAIFATLNGQGKEFTPGTTLEVVQGDAVELQAIPVPGWRFVRWIGAAESSGNPLSLELAHDETIAAEFQPDLFVVFLPLVR